MRYEFDSIYHKLFDQSVADIDNYMKNSLFGTRMLNILSSTYNSTHANTLLDSGSVQVSMYSRKQ